MTSGETQSLLSLLWRPKQQNQLCIWHLLQNHPKISVKKFKEILKNEKKQHLSTFILYNSCPHCVIVGNNFEETDRTYIGEENFLWYFFHNENYVLVKYLLRKYKIKILNYNLKPYLKSYLETLKSLEIKKRDNKKFYQEELWKKRKVFCLIFKQEPRFVNLIDEKNESPIYYLVKNYLIKLIDIGARQWEQESFQFFDFIRFLVAKGGIAHPLPFSSHEIRNSHLNDFVETKDVVCLHLGYRLNFIAGITNLVYSYYESGWSLLFNLKECQRNSLVTAPFAFSNITSLWKFWQNLISFIWKEDIHLFPIPFFAK